MNARTLAERKREEEKQKHLDRIYGERAEQAKREMEGEFPGRAGASVLLLPYSSEPQGPADWTEVLGQAAPVWTTLATCPPGKHHLRSFAVKPCGEASWTWSLLVSRVAWLSPLIHSPYGLCCPRLCPFQSPNQDLAGSPGLGHMPGTEPRGAVTYLQSTPRQVTCPQASQIPVPGGGTPGYPGPCMSPQMENCVPRTA